MYSQRFVSLNNTSIFCLVLSNCATGFPVLTKLKSTRHCCWHRNLQLSTSIFHFSLNSSSSSSMKKIPRDLLALSSFGFSMAHFCFSLRFDVSDICFHKSGHTLSGLEVVCFLVSLHPNHVCPSSEYNESREACPCIRQFCCRRHSSNRQ